MTRRSHMDPLRLDGLDSWITRADPRDEEPVACKVCGGEGGVPVCEIRGHECTCFGLARTDCEISCPNSGGKGWL